MELDAFRAGLDGWLDEHHAQLSPGPEHGDPLAAHLTHLSRVRRLLWDAGWARWGWPERVGGAGGSTLLRAYLGEAVTARGYVEPGLYSMTETLLPTLIDHADPALAARMAPLHLSGDETWCQGFSEPGTGSNLGALTCRAVRTDDGWRVTGQKVWTSLAQYSQRCVLLTRTGPVESAHRGITALFVDMDTAGITVRPIETMHGMLEFCEVFFDDVAVPYERTLGAVDGGWSIAMDLLPFERSTALWHRAAFLDQRLRALVAEAPHGALDADRVGDVLAQLYAFRARSRATQHRLANGERLGPETSVDKIMVATTEQAVLDLAAEGLGSLLCFTDDEVADRWRSDYLYSRAATIYGGSAEIQRNILARRVLNLGDER
jgi:alkylation response protein AidB-like acyl-CoA dehydrogenase